MKIIPLQIGRYLSFPPPSQSAVRSRWTFQSMTGEDWTAVTVQTGPSSILGTFYELAGGTGDPPNIIDYQIKSPNNLSGGSTDSESLRDFFRPVEEGQTVSIRLDSVLPVRSALKDRLGLEVYEALEVDAPGFGSRLKAS